MNDRHPPPGQPNPPPQPSSTANTSIQPHDPNMGSRSTCETRLHLSGRQARPQTSGAECSCSISLSNFSPFFFSSIFRPHPFLLTAFCFSSGRNWIVYCSALLSGDEGGSGREGHSGSYHHLSIFILFLVISVSSRLCFVDACCLNSMH